MTKPSAAFPALSLLPPGPEAELWLAPRHGGLSSRVPGTERWNRAEVATSISEARGHEAETGSPGKLLRCLAHDLQLLTGGVRGHGAVGWSL